MSPALPVLLRGLTADQRRLVRAALASMPADFFCDADLPLLREWAVAQDAGRHLGDEIAAFIGPVADRRVLMDLRDREVRRGASLARTLRLPPQSRYDRQAAATALDKGGARPRSWRPDDAVDDWIKTYGMPAPRPRS